MAIGGFFGLQQVMNKFCEMYGSGAFTGVQKVGA